MPPCSGQTRDSRREGPSRHEGLHDTAGFAMRRIPCRSDLATRRVLPRGGFRMSRNKVTFDERGLHVRPSLFPFLFGCIEVFRQILLLLICNTIKVKSENEKRKAQ